ncbi:MAG: hypothetical protein B7X75_08085 [Sphingobacteriales bacterium 39-40-5]|nr:MAG: hypothetical protein B7X75_08085 [Sphingobacteriales bacterium 39-40-5]
MLVVSNNVVQKKFCNPRADQRAKNKESGRAGLSMNNRIKNLQPITYNLQLHLTTKKIYDSQIGVREQGINTGPQVEEYLNYVNLKRGQPWCAAFICWVYGQANVDNPRTGWSPDLFKGNKVIWDRAESVKLKVESREKYQVEHSWYQDEIFLEPMSVHPTTNNQQLTTKSQQPTTADIFGLFFPEKNRIAHAGFVDQWDGTWLITVEGNTNVSGGREGDGVYRKRRLVKSVYQVARYIGVPYS